MDHEQELRLDDGDDLQLESAVVGADPDEAFAHFFVPRNTGRLDVLNDVQGPCLADPMPPRRLREADSHSADYAPQNPIGASAQRRLQPSR
jgi:hypothetical protein